MSTQNLLHAFLRIFPENDAFLLTEILDKNLCRETIHYEEIDMAEDQKRDLILLAFEERILIPIKSRSGPAWEDKILDFGKASRYSIPPIVKAILKVMGTTGEPSSGTAIRTTLADFIKKDIDGFIGLLQAIMKHADHYTFETGLLDILFKQVELDSDLHDIIDIFVICGIMSPCPRKSLLTGLSWYEINPTLYWDKTFLA
jgi:hypothetical protein